MGNGQVYLLYTEANTGLRYLTGSETTAPSTWTKQLAPGGSDYDSATFDLALDSSGQPGVAYEAVPTGSSYNHNVWFWRPPATTATRVTTSNNIH